MVPAFICARFLIVAFAQFEKLPDKPGLFPIPKSSKRVLVFIVIASVIAVAIGIILLYYTYYSFILRSTPQMPEYLKKTSIIVNPSKFTKNLFWKASGIGAITDINYSNNTTRIASTRGFISLDKNLDVLSYLKFNKCSFHTDIVYTNKDAIYGFINRGNYNCDAAFFDSTGKVVWTYRGNTSVYDMSAGDIEGDGTVEFIIGFSGDGGIHLLDSNGKKKWEESDKNVWHVELVDIDSDGVLEILHTNAHGEIIVRNREGKIISKTKSSPYFSSFSLAKWPNDKGREYILLSKNNVIWLLDFDGSVIEKLTAPNAGTLGDAKGVPVKFNSELPEYFAVIVDFSIWDRSILYIYNFNNKLVYQEIIPEPCASITAKPQDNSTLQTLLIGCNDKIWQYEKET